jgi:hypothetical protein
MSQHFLQSSYREKLIEHLFVGELLRHSWHVRECALEIARPEVDNCGYDLIAADGFVTRHIQLKSTHQNATAARQKVHTALASKPSGCLVWIYFEEETLDLGPFLFFGGTAGERMPTLEKMRVARHTKANSLGVKTERAKLRVIPRASFTQFNSLGALYAALFIAPSAKNTTD